MNEAIYLILFLVKTKVAEKCKKNFIVSKDISNFAFFDGFSLRTSF